jgi:hypothetical protein
MAAVSGTFAATGGALTIPIAVTTGMFAGMAVRLSTMSGAAASYNGLIFTITSVIASTSITVVCPASWSFSYATTTGNVTLQAAYMMLQSNDALSTAYPIYVKLELFCQFGGTYGVPCLGVTVGTGGTNGFGSLTTPCTTTIYAGVYEGGSQDVVNLRPCYAAGDAGSFRTTLLMPMGVGSFDTYQGLWFVISRSHDNNGNSTGTYVMVWCGGFQATAHGCFQTVFNTSIGGVTIQDQSGYLMTVLPQFNSPNNFSGAYGGTTMVSPVFQNVGGISNPTPDFLCGSKNDFPNNSTATISVFGINHNYVSYCAAQAMPNAGAATSTSVALLFRYE